MANAKHTPGPFFVRAFSGDYYIMSNSGYVLTHIKAISAYRKSHKANADLFAAAPDLLAALERILYAHDNHGNGAAMGEAVLCQHYASMARASIAKATGSQP